MGDVETCKELFDLAKRCGCNAVKLQKRENRSLYTRDLYDQVYDNRNSFGKPMIVSTGGGTMADIHRAYETIYPINKQLCFLQCTTAYRPIRST